MTTTRKKSAKQLALAVRRHKAAVEKLVDELITKVRETEVLLVEAMNDGILDGNGNNDSDEVREIRTYFSELKSSRLSIATMEQRGLFGMVMGSTIQSLVSERPEMKSYSPRKKSDLEKIDLTDDMKKTVTGQSIVETQQSATSRALNIDDGKGVPNLPEAIDEVFRNFDKNYAENKGYILTPSKTEYLNMQLRQQEVRNDLIAMGFKPKDLRHLAKVLFSLTSHHACGEEERTTNDVYDDKSLTIWRQTSTPAKRSGERERGEFHFVGYMTYNDLRVLRILQKKNITERCLVRATNSVDRTTANAINVVWSDGPTYEPRSISQEELDILLKDKR